MIPRLTRGDFDRVAAWCGMGSVRFDDLKPVFEAVLAAMSPLAEMPALQLKQPKAVSVDDPGAFDGSNSSAMDDPLNTFVRRCNVAPTTPVLRTSGGRAARHKSTYPASSRALPDRLSDSNGPGGCVSGHGRT